MTLFENLMLKNMRSVKKIFKSINITLINNGTNTRDGKYYK